MCSSEEISKYANNLENGMNIYRSLKRLFCIEIPFELYKNHGVKHLALKYSRDSEYSEIAINLINKIQKMENDSVVFRKPYVIPHAGYLTRRRPATLPNPSSKPKISAPKSSSIELPIETVISVEKTSDLAEVLKLKNLEESDYDRVRPTLVTLSAKQLKRFMDRNPGIEKVGDGLFRRHCQIDCPQNIPKKLLTETWRTLHDVHINWILYTEAKRLEDKSRDEIEKFKKSFS